MSEPERTPEKRAKLIEICAERMGWFCESEQQLREMSDAVVDAASAKMRARMDEERMAFDFQEALGVMKRGGSVRRRDWDKGVFLHGVDGVVQCAYRADDGTVKDCRWEPDGGFSLTRRNWLEV